jgi:hypothetical protein
MMRYNWKYWGTVLRSQQIEFPYFFQGKGKRKATGKGEKAEIDGEADEEDESKSNERPKVRLVHDFKFVIFTSFDGLSPGGH